MADVYSVLTRKPGIRRMPGDAVFVGLREDERPAETVPGRD
jgi:hypothetical protein